MPSPPATHRRRRHLLQSLLILSLLLFPFSAAAAADDDRSALIHFKSSVSDSAGLLSSWSGHDPCSWPGVACDAGSRVVALNISAVSSASSSPSCTRSGPFRRSCSGVGDRLTGHLHPAIRSLSELRILSLRFHFFHGEIPPEIWGLEHLEVLDLEGNSLSGVLPRKFPNRLRVLNLASNLLIEGGIPVSLSECASLEILDLSGNRINGTVPGFLGEMAGLRELHLEFNLLGGSIPYGIGAGCRSLQHLHLSGNLLVGSIPSSLGNCSELRSLLLFSNLLEDAIPKELGLLRKLLILDVSRNSLSGALPAELGGCVGLTVLVLSNPFDPVPFLDDSSYGIDDCNYFEGGIPENITMLPELRMLWAPRASLEGEMPRNWGACKSLEMVHLSQNLFTGGIPTAFEQCQSLKFLNFSSNKLTGWLSEELMVPCMDIFDVSGNQLSSLIPRFVSRSCLSSQLAPDDLSAAFLSFFASSTHTRISFPSFHSGLGSVIYHNFGDNNFTGPLHSLPAAVERYGNQTVYAFFAHANQLSGSLMNALSEKCSAINGLVANFSNNIISGGIPSDFGTICKSLVAFDLSGNHMSGMIPRSMELLEGLIWLDLSRNWFQGLIPDSFGNVKNLEYLSLARNNLTGHIPAGFNELHSLKVLDMSSNSLSGEIPSGLADLKDLNVLLLDNNMLSGRIPSGLVNVASLSMFNLSFNNLSGPLPSNVSTIGCDSVLGNPLLPCHVLSLSSPPSDRQGQSENWDKFSDTPESSPSQSSSSGFSSIEIASITSASAIVLVLLALIVLYVYTRKCTPGSMGQSSGRKEVTVFTDIGVPLTYETVVRATGNFNASNCIGSGGFGATYKAEVSPGVLVAIKRLSIGRIQGVQQFHAEIKTLGRWRHPNLVTLIGYHVSEAEMFLIYNYLPGGNLERFIHERSKRPVDWRMLHKIALDVARALAYLHDQCVPRILHRDVKPSNILLDNGFNAYLSDFGLARLLGNSETHATTGVAGTFGYVAPEYAMTCRVSDKADVYSYGVVLLELISDKKALDPSFSPYGNGFNIVAWACMLLRQGRAREFFTKGLWDVGPHDDLVETLHLAVMCTVDSLSIRPTMKQVVQRLKQLQPPTC